MREIVLGIAAAIVIAVGAGIWLQSVQESASQRYAAPVSVRL
jgi:hypothetical protein